MVRSKSDKARPQSLGRPGQSRSNGTIFMVAALDMSWRLAIAVLVPIIGGYELDKHLNTSPALVITGFVVAMAGLFLILKQTVATADEKFNPKGSNR